MKKVFFTALTLASIFAVQAQETQQTAFKPKAGDLGLEVVFNPLAGVALHSENSSFSSFALNNFTSQFPWLKGRFFISDDIALRAGFRLGLQNTSRPELTQGTVTQDDHTTSVFSLAFLPGIEKHFKGTEKLSPYVGAELALGVVSASATDETTDGGITSKYVSTGSTATPFNGVTDGVRSSVSFGLNAVAGADYYFVKRAYLGIEVGFGLNYVSFGEVKAESSETNQPTVTNTRSPKSSAISIIPSAVGALRLGFWF